MINITKLCLIIIFVLSTAMAQRKAGTKKNVIIKYKKYESFDLGNLEIKGKIMAPGDLSVKERRRSQFGRNLYSKDDYSSEINEDIRNLR